MPTRIHPAIKGLITAVLMIALVLYIYANRETANPSLQYFIYAIYALGVLWTLLAYRRSEAFTGRFGGLFNQGFRCFIIVTICMVLFTAIFNKMHPEFAAERAEAYRVELNKSKDHMPADVEEQVAQYKKQYTTRIVYSAIFGYLIVGAAFTSLASVLLTRRT